MGAGWSGSEGGVVGHLIGFITLGQEAIGANTSNPVGPLWEGIWKPTSYSQGNSNMYTWHAGTNTYTHEAIWVDIAGPPQRYELGWCGAVNSEIQFPMVPGPGTIAVLSAAGLLGPR